MSFWTIFKVAVLAILRNKTRAALTCHAGGGRDGGVLAA